MEKIKILHFTISQSKGGRTQYILNAWKNINKERYLFDFVTFSPKLDFEKELLNQGRQVFYLTCYYKDNPDQFIKEFDQVLSNKYDIIHIHTSYWENDIVEKRAKYWGIKKIIIHAHNTGISKALTLKEYNEKKRIHEKMKKIVAIDLATDFCACSNDAAEWIFGNRVPKNQINILKNGIDTKKYEFNIIVRKRIRDELNIMDETIVLGVVGRLVYQKNQEFIIEVINRMRGYYNHIKLLVIGDGENYEKLLKIVKNTNLEDYVEFLGYRENIYELLQALDIFCMPSKSEALGMALLEAQCSNLQCVVSDKVAKDACLSDRVTRASLVYDIWEKIINDIIMNKTYLSRKTSDIVKKSGFDIKDQIYELEKLYNVIG